MVHHTRCALCDVVWFSLFAPCMSHCPFFSRVFRFDFHARALGYEYRCMISYDLLFHFVTVYYMDAQRISRPVLDRTHDADPKLQVRGLSSALRIFFGSQCNGSNLLHLCQCCYVLVWRSVHYCEGWAIRVLQFWGTSLANPAASLSDIFDGVLE